MTDRYDAEKQDWKYSGKVKITALDSIARTK
jgi:hypothetical protein